MQQAPPPPPPPPLPPPLPPPIPSLLFPKTFKDPFCQSPCSGAESSEQMEASKLCERILNSQLCLKEEHLWISLYNRVLPVLQEGPSCGLAALCMAGQLIKDAQKSPRIIALADAIEIAQKRRYTFHGEMFSASNMRDLAEELLFCKVELLSNGFEQQSKIICHLAKGLPILVPYDSGPNHEPCCKLGHKAHWAVLLGLVFKSSTRDALPRQTFKEDPLLPWLYHGCLDDEVEASIKLQGTVLDQSTSAIDIFVYARQGKSSHTGLWNLKNLASSNANLWEVNPKRRNSIHQYVIPDDGISNSLCRQVLLLG